MRASSSPISFWHAGSAFLLAALYRCVLLPMAVLLLEGKPAKLGRGNLRPSKVAVRTLPVVSTSLVEHTIHVCAAVRPLLTQFLSGASGYGCCCCFGLWPVMFGAALLAGCWTG